MGCLLGCATGDAIGLPFEGMKRERVSKYWPEGDPLKHRFIFGCGMLSDDTDHSIFVTQAMRKHPSDPDAFARCLAWRLRFWLLCLPAGIGFATLRGILKLWLGFPPNKSGVFSAGNGPAMRSAVIGAFFADDPELRRAYVTASTKVSHSDPKAKFGAQAIAEIAALGDKPTIDELRQLLNQISDRDDWREVVTRIIADCESGKLTHDNPRGVSGYVYETVPVAIVAWYLHHGDFRQTVESVIRLGGDTDTVAAIAGALAGASSGESAIPTNWLDGLSDFPHSRNYMTKLAAANPAPLRFSAWLFPRGVIFTILVLGHGLRRLFV